MKGCFTLAHGLYFLLLCSNLVWTQNNNHKCKAPPELERKVAIHPTAVAYEELGAYFGQLNDFSCAIPAFRSSIRLAPNSASTRYYLALALLASGDPQHAAQEARTTLKLNPKQPQAHMTLGAA